MSTSTSATTYMRRVLRGLSLAMACSVGAIAHASIGLPSTPLQTGAVLPPNIMFILDDSGSMGYNFMPESISDGLPNASIAAGIRGRSANNNTLWYNPLITYQPGRDADGNSLGNRTLAAVRTDAYDGGNTTTSLVSTTNWPSDGYNDGISNNSVPFYLSFYTLTGANANSNSSYSLYEFRRNSSNAIEARKWSLKSTGARNSSLSVISFSWSVPGGGTITRTVAQEAANFANWYTYYRKRILMAKTASSIAFSQLSKNYRIGFTTIWDRNTFDIPVGTLGGLFDGTNRTTWFSRLYGAAGSSTTPLPNALYRVGNYFKNVSASGPWGPESGANQLSCRGSFAILTTDGYWNVALSNTVGNQDNTAGSTHTSTTGQTYTYQPVAPYQDSTSNTLADVAMYYWKNDLRTDLPNNVPTSSEDPAFWQHMVTYGISIGLAGTLNPDTDLAGLTSGSISWPAASSSKEAENIDDLWHAAVNGHGRFFVASDPQEFADTLKAVLLNIGQRTSSAASLAVTSRSLKSGPYVYQASFTTSSPDGNWFGDLAAYKLDTSGNFTMSGGQPVATWKASSVLPAHGSRLIVYRDSGGATKSFTSATLSSTDLTTIGSADIVNYLRGDQSKEIKNGGTFRNRKSPLGDIVHSSPAYDAASGLIFVGANDGMLHAFNAADGVEKFAVVPRSLFSSLGSLSDPLYAHRFFVDGEIAISDKTTSLGKTIAVAALGHGGQTLIAVDATTPSAPVVLWEFSNTVMGNVLGKPVITKTNSGTWVALVGNGVNSSGDTGRILMIDLINGTLLATLDTQVASNGVISVAATDFDGNGTVDYVYGGDLVGNVWKFKTSSGSSAQWVSALTTGSTPKPLFVAKDSGGVVQPITGGMEVGINPFAGAHFGKVFVWFGTGRLITESDIEDKSVQTWYALIDDNTQITGRSALRQRTVIDEGTVNGNNARVISAAASGDMDGKQGWYLDLLPPSATAQGERILTAPTFLTPTIIGVNSWLPVSTNPCDAGGGKGWTYALDAYDGGQLDATFFDLNGDGKYDSDDYLNGKPVGAVGSSGEGAITHVGSKDMGVTIVKPGMTYKSDTQGLPNGRSGWRDLQQ